MYRRDLSLQLLALYLLFIGPVVIASVIFDRLASQRLEAEVKGSDQALARAIALETSAAMDSALQSVRQLATYPAILSGDQTGMAEIYQILLTTRSDVNLVYRLDASGTMTYHYPSGPSSTVGQDFSFREYFERAQTTHSPFLSSGRISPTTGQAVATAVMPLWNDTGQFLGVAATNIKLQSLSHTLSSIVSSQDPPGSLQVTILDSAGSIIAHSDTSNLLLTFDSESPEVAQAVLQGQEGSQIQHDQLGEEKLYSYIPIPSIGWGVIIQRKTSEAFATLSQTHRSVLALLAVFLSFGVLFWLALSRQVIRPMEQLATFAQSVGESRLSNTEHRNLRENLALIENLARRPDQIGYLSRSLERMSAAIQARLNELSTLLDTSAVVVSSLETRIVLNRILEQVERLLGVDISAIIALDQARGIFRVQASRGLSQRYTETLAIDPAEPLSVTLRAIHAGEPIQISDTETDPSYTTFRARAQAEGYRSIIAVPLKTQHTPPAALLVYKPEAHIFTENEINLLTSFGNHAAMAIENAALYAHSDTRLQEQTRRLEALIHSLQDGLILEDLQGKIRYANPRIAELAGIENQLVTQVPAHQVYERILGNALDQKQAVQLLDSLKNGDEQCSGEITLSFEGRRFDLNLQTFDVTDANQQPIGRGLIIQDVTRTKEIDRMKSSLVSTVSHELRTPLAAIKGYTTTLLADDVDWDPKAQREFLEIILSETDRLGDLVNDLLDMSRIEAGSLTVNRQPCRLPELISQAVQRAQPAPGDRLQLDLPEDLPYISVDPRRMEAVLRNLIENAAKYSSTPLPIFVRARVEGDRLIIRVEDQGPGIPAEHSHRIFESFYRVENGLSRTTPGSGVGLAIAQGFIRAHGGEIWLEPRQKGTSIAFWLPLNLDGTG